MTKREKNNLIDTITETQDVMSSYPLHGDGSKDFLGSPVKRPLSREDVVFLVDQYIGLRKAGKTHQDAVRVTYGCAYRKSDLRFNPHARVAELRDK